MITQLAATLALDSHDTIGEGPTWDAAQARLLWSDNSSGVIHEAKRDGVAGWRESRQWNVGRPIAAAIPRAKGGVIVVGGTEAFFLDDAGRITPFARIDADPDQVKLNEAKCDARGRLWAGTRDNDFSVPGRKITPGRCALYRIDPDGAVTRALENVSLSNGLDWSPDGRTLYYIDTYTRAVDAFDFDIDQGTIRGRRTVVRIQVGEGLPDGMTVDRDGHLWVAIAGAGQVRRYSPDGAWLARIDVPTPTVTSCAFGGLSGAELFITSARVRLPVSALTGLTHGLNIEMAEQFPAVSGPGGVFALRPGPTGAPATPFAG
jgi:sugar lactone lactonase YvrE